MEINGLILAGGEVDDRLRDRTHVTEEALIPIGQHFMVEYVVQAVKNSGTVGKTAVVGPVEQLQEKFKEDSEIVLAPGGETVALSVVNGLEVLPPSDYVLICSSDIPLVNGPALKGFVTACLEMGAADIYYPIVERSISEKHYPQAERTFVKLADGSFTGGNVFLLRPEIVASRIDVADYLISLRKDPIALCKAIGAGFITKFLLRQLTVKEAEEKASALLDLKALAVKCDYPEISMDVDKPSDLDLVEQVLGIVS